MNRRSRSTRTCVSLRIDRQVAKHRPKCRSTRTCVQNRCIRALPNSEAKVQKNREPRSKTFECQADNTVFFGTYPFFCHIQTTIQAYSAETNTRCPTPRTPASEVIPHPSPGPATPAFLHHIHLPPSPATPALRSRKSPRPHGLGHISHLLSERNYQRFKTAVRR